MDTRNFDHVMHSVDLAPMIKSVSSTPFQGISSMRLVDFNEGIVLFQQKNTFNVGSVDVVKKRLLNYWSPVTKGNKNSQKNYVKQLDIYEDHLIRTSVGIDKRSGCVLAGTLDKNVHVVGTYFHASICVHTIQTFLNRWTWRKGRIFLQCELQLL